MQLAEALPEDTEALILLFGDRAYEVSEELTLSPDGYCWLRVRRTDQRLLL